MPLETKHKPRENIRTEEFCKRAEELLLELGTIGAVAQKMGVHKYHVELAIHEGPYVPLALRKKKQREQGLTK
jgi:hypothetical protein